MSEVASIATPAAGTVSLHPDNSVNPQFRQVDDTGKSVGLLGLTNSSTASQSIAAATKTYINGSNMLIPVNKMQVGSAFRWKFNITKTSAGTAASTYVICCGTLGTTADATVCTFTKPAGTAAADEGFVTVDAVVRSIGAAGIIVAEFTMWHNLAATGHATIPCVVVNSVGSALNMDTANLIIGMCITSGASDAITIQMCQAEGRGI